MLDNKKLSELVQKYGLSVVIAQKNLLSKQLISGSNSDLVQSIDFKSKITAGKIEIDFTSNEYGEFVNDGRKPGKYVPVSKLREWTRSKGIPDSAVFPINKKIFEKGIKPKPWINAPFSKTRENLKNEIVKLYREGIVSAFTKELKG